MNTRFIDMTLDAQYSKTTINTTTMFRDTEKTPADTVNKEIMIIKNMMKLKVSYIKYP